MLLNACQKNRSKRKDEEKRKQLSKGPKVMKKASSHTRAGVKIEHSIEEKLKIIDEYN